jgi:hypothetical protein
VVTENPFHSLDAEHGTKMLNRLMLFVFLMCGGCGTRSGVYGYYRYPAGITKQCHLKIDSRNVSLISLEEQRLYESNRYVWKDGKIVIIGTKERLELSPGESNMVDQAGQMYPKVRDSGTLERLKGIK